MNNDRAMVQQSITDVSPIGHLGALLVSLRPHQWVKNTLIFVGIIFSFPLLQWHLVWLSLGAFAVFCLASSGIYLLNDLCDLEADRWHPTKRFRPLAAGELRPATAKIVSVSMLAGSVLAALALRPLLGLVLSAYVLLNVAYSLRLKRVILLDAIAIACGFVLRVVAGAVVIGAESSPWLILHTFTLTLLVGFGKRRYDLAMLQAAGQQSPSSRARYSARFLDRLMPLTGIIAIVTYVLYTTASETVIHLESFNLLLTTPCVVFGIVRFVELMQRRTGSGDPARLFVTDPPLLICIVLWAIAVCLILYGAALWR